MKPMSADDRCKEQIIIDATGSSIFIAMELCLLSPSPECYFFFLQNSLFRLYNALYSLTPLYHMFSVLYFFTSRHYKCKWPLFSPFFFLSHSFSLFFFSLSVSLSHCFPPSSPHYISFIPLPPPFSFSLFPFSLIAEIEGKHSFVTKGLCWQRMPHNSYCSKFTDFQISPIDW